MRLATLSVLLLTAVNGPAFGQQTPAAAKPAPFQVTVPAEQPADAASGSIAFEGGSFTITDTPDGDKLLDFDGTELARNYVLYFDRIVTVSDTKVALFDVGDGGNQCGPATVIAWKPKDEALRTDMVGEECGAPPAAATEAAIYFVPSPLPGDSSAVQVWTPERGLRVAGTLEFAPQPGTAWKDLDPDKLDNIVEAFDNAAVYEAGENLLGADMVGFVTGLLTGGGVEKTASGIFYASGCVPHACGSADAFMAVDPKGRKLYLAQAGGQPQPRTWPPLKGWPRDVRTAMTAALTPPQ